MGKVIRKRDQIDVEFSHSQGEALRSLLAMSQTSDTTSPPRPAPLRVRQEGDSGVQRAPHRYRDDDPYLGGYRRDRRRAREAAAQARQPSASVLIPAHNESETIRDVVRACLSNGYPLVDVIVVADSCTDDTALVARRAGASLVLETSFADKAGAQNAALPYIRSDVIVGFDGDTLPEPGCIPLMLADIAAGADATCATILPLQPGGFFVSGRRFAYALGRRWWRLAQAKVGRIQVLTGAAYAFRTDALLGIGGFPNGLISADMDATWALHRAKKKLAYSAKAVALTVEPDTFRVYRAQMRRWSSGYFQNVARYRKEVMHPRSLLVIGTAMFDLVSLFAYETLFVIAVATGHFWMARTLIFWLIVHALVTTGLVASVVGVPRAVRGYFPYFVLNYYNKWLYLCAFVREWILGRHYAAWTGRQGRKTVITPMTRKRKLALTSVAAVALVGVAINYQGLEQRIAGQVTSLMGRRHLAASASGSPAPSAPPALAPIAPNGHYVGLISTHLATFDQLCACKPGLTVSYIPWGRPASLTAIRAAAAEGAESIIELQPDNITLRSIAAGRHDQWLNAWAASIRSFNEPVLLSFAPEANGNWDSWGYQHASASMYISAWRHVVNIFRSAHADKVTWIWIVNRNYNGSEPDSAIWPGDSYVGMVGIDGYFESPTDMFASFFGPSIADIRKFTNRPILLSEVGADPKAGKARAVSQLVAGVKRYGLAGFVWFDRNDIGNPRQSPKNQQDWRLEVDPAALAAFRTAVRQAA